MKSDNYFHAPVYFLRSYRLYGDIVNRTIPAEELQKKDDEFLSEATMEDVPRVKLMLVRIDHDIHLGCCCLIAETGNPISQRETPIDNPAIFLQDP